MTTKSKDRSIPVLEMKDGQTGVITKWVGGYRDAIGTHVKRVGDDLKDLNTNDSWSSIFSYYSDVWRHDRVLLDSEPEQKEETQEELWNLAYSTIVSYEPTEIGLRKAFKELQEGLIITRKP